MSAATSDGKERSNSLRLPQGEAEAFNFVFNRLKKLYGDRKYCTGRQKDILEAARAKNLAPASVRTALRVSRMTPERRQKYVDGMNAALKMFGYEVGTMEEQPPTSLINGMVAELMLVANERNEINEQVKETCQVARDAGMPVDVIKDLIGISELDPEDREAKYYSFDKYGTFLGWW